jgi:hypothetical protein
VFVFQGFDQCFQHSLNILSFRSTGYKNSTLSKEYFDKHSKPATCFALYQFTTHARVGSPAGFHTEQWLLLSTG